MTTSNLTLRGWPRELQEPEGRILYALESYQIIETALKAYLSRYANNQSDSKITKKYAAANVLEKPLGWLLQEFKLVNSNEELHQILKRIVKERNEIAHQALVTQSSEAASILGVTPMSIQKLREIDRRAMKASTKVVCEFIKNTPKNLEI